MTELEFEILGEVRNPPSRARDGRYREVYNALTEAQKSAPQWVAIAVGDKTSIQKVRNAVSRQVNSEPAWHTQIHIAEDDTVTLFVKFDKQNPRKSRRPRKVPVAVAASEETPEAEWLPDEE